MSFRKINCAFVLFFVMMGLQVSAQSVDSLIVAGDSLRKMYRFEESLQAYKAALAQAQKDSLDSASRIQEKIFCSENGKNMMAFADSPVVESRHKFSSNDFFLYYPLPDSSWRHTPNQLDSLGGPFAKAIYYPESSKRICYSSRDTTAVRSIYITEFKDTSWTAPTLLGGASFSSSDEIYPMLSKDGKTLYFSSNGLYGVGGYDIYVSNWDDEKGVWGAPMNMGFPYSSPADDFLYTSSEDDRYVVFASNRDCSSDSVWVYVLKHQDVPVRKAVGDPEELLRLSKLDPVGYQERVDAQVLVEADIPENLDTKKYLSAITQVRALQDSVSVYSERLEKDRAEYAESADEKEKSALASKILEQEAAIPVVQERLDEAKNQLHKIEMEFLFSGVVIDPDKLLAQADREVVGEATSYTFEKNEYGPDFKLQ